MISKSGLYNDGSAHAPRLQVLLNLGTLVDLPAGTLWPGLEGGQRYQRLLQDGFEGVQLIDDSPLIDDLSLPHCGLNRVDFPGQADRIFHLHTTRGDSCLTLHAGSGLESDDEIARLVEAILNASSKCRLPAFLETHRATITQDLWRTVQIAARFPEIRFNGDFSHYYCGLELVYGDWDTKLAFMQPIFARTGFLHGRIASPGCMQVPLAEDLSGSPAQAPGGVNFVAHFTQLWTRAMLGFLGRAENGDVLLFAPELLQSSIYYARLFPHASGGLIEECDRYTQALRYKDLACKCFEAAQNLHLQRRSEPHTTETE